MSDPLTDALTKSGHVQAKFAPQLATYVRNELDAMGVHLVTEDSLAAALLEYMPFPPGKTCFPLIDGEAQEVAVAIIQAAKEAERE